MSEHNDFYQAAQPVFQEEEAKDNKKLIVASIAAVTLVFTAVTVWLLRRRRIKLETRTAMNMLAEPKFFAAAEKRARAIQKAVGKNVDGWTFRCPFR